MKRLLSAVSIVLTALALSPPARAVTAIAIDGHSDPVTLTVGEPASSRATGAPLQDAVVWAAKDLNTLVASASIRPDGSYTLPVPPGTYVVFAEWFGNLRSQRQVVTVAAGQEVKPVNLALLQGQEV